MTLYELTEAMRNFDLEIDEETGEILNAEELDMLQMEHDLKLKNCVYYYKNIKAEAEALKAEKLKLAQRQKAAERKAEWMERYIASDLDGKEFAPEDDVTVKVKWRKSKSVECDDITLVPEEYLRFKAPEIDKTKIKKAIEGGIDIDGCRIVVNNNIQIK